MTLRGEKLRRDSCVGCDRVCKKVIIKKSVFQRLYSYRGVKQCAKIDVKCNGG